MRNAEPSSAAKAAEWPEQHMQFAASKTSMIRVLSQSITRANGATWQEDALRHIGPTLLSRQMLWAKAPARSSSRSLQARLMLGREALRLQGFLVMTFVQDISEIANEKKFSTDSSRTQSGKHLPNEEG